jgi:hypothetical protein
MLAAALAIGLAGATNSTEAQKAGADGTNDAEEQKAMIRRDPFWPVGYVPKKVTSIVPVEISTQSEVKVDNSWNEAMKKVVINGVSSRAENAYIAVINGQIKSIGDTVTVNHSGTLYTWAVDGVEPPDSVKLRRVSAM